MPSDREHIRKQLLSGMSASEIIQHNEDMLRQKVMEGFVRLSDFPTLLANLGQLVMQEEKAILDKELLDKKLDNIVTKNEG